MQNKKLTLTRELFIETINALKAQDQHDDKCRDAFAVILPEDHRVMGYDNLRLVSAITNLLVKLTGDFEEDGVIEYFIYDLEYGEKYRDDCFLDKDDTPIDISDAGKLYDYLIK